MKKNVSEKTDIVLIGAGIMSATLGTFLKELDPALNITLFERLDDCAKESSYSWNNAGTGHAANCEMNYTPQRADGTVDISEALEVNTEFDISRQFWSYLVNKGKIKDPGEFIHSCPHMSFVQGAESVKYLKQRFDEMSAHHCYHGMEYSDDFDQIAKWTPLITEGRDRNQPIAMTRMITGADVDYGALTHILISELEQQSGFTLHYKHEVKDLKRDSNGEWLVTVKDLDTHEKRVISAKFVFIGAGGRAIELLQKSEIPEGKGCGGFPVGGIWLRCDVPDVVEQHHAKVYSKAAKGSPPMSVPHLDTRIIGGKKSLLFGPYAGFSTKFLKHGSYADLFKSVRPGNILPMLDVAKDNMGLVEYLIGQVLQTHHHQFGELQAFYPLAKPHDWVEVIAGQRVQIIKPDKPEKEGILQFGTELVSSEDESLVALLGASPGASTAAFIALNVLKKCFSQQLADGWQKKLEEIIPTFGIDLKVDADACHETRQRTAKILNLEFI